MICLFLFSDFGGIILLGLRLLIQSFSDVLKKLESFQVFFEDFRLQF